MKARSFGAALVIFTTGSCNGINVSRITEDGPKTGVPWNLAMTQYKLSITRQVTKCEADGIKGSVTVAVVPTKTLDDRQQYVLDGTGWWATSDITSTLAPDGTSTGLNAHSESQAAQIIANVVSIAATAAIGLDGEPTKLLCNDKVKKALAEMDPGGNAKSQKDIVSLDTAAVSAATDKVTLLTTQTQANAAYKKALAAAQTELMTAQVKLNADQAQLNKNLSVVSNTQDVYWPQKSNQFSTSTPFKMPPSVIANWANLPDGTDPENPPGIKEFQIYASLYASLPTGGWEVPKGTRPQGDVAVGVPVRVARVGRLVVCTGDPCDSSLPADWTPKKGQTLALKPDQPVLQLGQMYNVRVAGGAFKSEGAVIALDGNGLPTSIEVSEKTSVAAAATGAVAAAGQQIIGIPGQVAAAQLARTQAQTAQINAQNQLVAAQASAQNAGPLAGAQAQTTLLNAQAALATAQANAQVAGPSGVLAAQTALINAQTANATAQANAGISPQTSALAAQTALINAQAAQINAQVALAKANALLSP